MQNSFFATAAAAAAVSQPVGVLNILSKVDKGKKCGGGSEFSPYSRAYI